MTHTADSPVPTELRALTTGEVLFDRHRREYFVTSRIDADGVGLRQRDTEFYIPHSLFVTWYGSRVFSIEETTSIDPPPWTRTTADAIEPAVRA